MKIPNKNLRNHLAITSIAAFAFAILTAVSAWAQCPVTELISGLQRPLGMTFSNKNNLIVAESGTTTPNSGRISIVDLNGNRRTLLSGLPSGISREGGGEPSGPIWRCHARSHALSRHRGGRLSPGRTGPWNANSEPESFLAALQLGPRDSF